MRNAAASFDDDDEYDQAPRHKPAGKARSSRKKTQRPRLRFRIDFNKMARVSALGAGVIVAIGIMVNALTLQKEHHPAPLFGKVVSLRQAAAKATPAPTPSTSARAPTAPAEATAQNAEATGSIPAPVPAARPHQDAKAAPSDRSKHVDPIARLLNGGAAVVNRTEDASLLNVQRALVKLHRLPKATGTMGPATKKAIAKFAKDQHLPAHDGISRRLVRALSSESGVKID